MSRLMSRQNWDWLSDSIHDSATTRAAKATEKRQLQFTEGSDCLNGACRVYWVSYTRISESYTNLDDHIVFRHYQIASEDYYSEFILDRHIPHSLGIEA